MSTTFTITKSFIEENKTPSGGYNKLQLSILGINWPPRSGWKHSLIGKEISFDTADKFVKAAKGDNAVFEPPLTSIPSSKCHIIYPTSSEISAIDTFIYTDGACINNGRPNAKASIGLCMSNSDTFSEFTISSLLDPNIPQTNNIAELTAIWIAYETIINRLANKKVCIVTDSDYAIKCITTYGDKCAAERWKKDIPNKDLVRKIYEALDAHGEFICVMHVNSHTAKKDMYSIGNDMADKLASSALYR